jgi:tetratricopeptide (TPR) repeat protein
MTSERWQQVQQVLDQLEEAAPDAVPGVIQAVCGNDEDLRREVESLLSFKERAERFDWNERSGAVPQRIGPYRVESLLGTGGMGAVYLAVRDGEYRKRVAIKVTATGGDAELLDRFRAERRIVAGLDHPYIARLLDGGALPDGRPYFVMELIEGQRIDAWVEQKKLDPSSILKLFLKVCSAVQFAHQNLVVHRDLKAGNILVSENGDPHLLDFGIAKVLDPSARANLEITQTLLRRMTPASASPEQVAGRAVTVSTDVYALGILLYRLLTGVSAYAEAKGFENDPAKAILEYEPPPASHAPGVRPKLKRALRGDLDNIVRKAIEKDPARRYASVEEFAADLERHLKGLPVEARPTSFWYRAAKFVRRNRLAVTAAALLLFAIAGGVAGTLSYARREHRAQLRAQRQLAALDKLLQSFLFEFDDAIKNLPGSSPARDLVERRAVEYLDKLASEAGDDPVMLGDLADAYAHVARMTGAGRMARAESSPRKALRNLLKALELRRRLLALNPNDHAAWVQLEGILWETAGAYFFLGELKNAEALSREELRMAERAGTVSERYNLGAVLTGLGDVERELGHSESAMSLIGRGLKVREEILRADPSSARAQRAVGISHSHMGYVLSEQHNYTAAALEQRLAVALWNPIAKAEPGNADIQRLAGIGEENLCEVLARGNAAAEAVDHCEAALATYGRMIAADPKNLQAMEDLASGETTMSIALDRSHALAAAFEHEQKSRRLFEALVRKDPDAPDLAEENAASLMELAQLRKELHMRGALKAAAEAVRIFEGLMSVEPENRRLGAQLEQAKQFPN